MSYRNMMQRIYAKRVLFSVLVELTYRCNLDCEFCYNDLSLKGRTMSVRDYRVLFDDLAAMGTMNLALSGGEPLARPEFFEIAGEAKRRGFVIRIKTNGHGLRRNIARRIRSEVDPIYLEISLHGARADTHDLQTRVPGSFARLMENLEILIEEGVRFRLKTPLTRWNEGEIEEIFLMADRLGVRVDFDPQVSPKDDGDMTPLGLTASMDGVARLYRILRERTATQDQIDVLPSEESSGEVSGKPHCGAGIVSATIDPFGNVLPCVQWRRPMGNLHQESIKMIWERSGASGGLQGTLLEVGAFVQNEGPDVRGAGFCPGTAQQQTGSPVKLYPAVLRGVEALRLLNGQEAPPR